MTILSKHKSYKKTISGRDVSKVLIGSVISDIPNDRVCLVCANLLGKTFYTDDDIFYEGLRRKRNNFKDFD